MIKISQQYMNIKHKQSYTKACTNAHPLCIKCNILESHRKPLNHAAENFIIIIVYITKAIIEQYTCTTPLERKNKDKPYKEHMISSTMWQVA